MASNRDIIEALTQEMFQQTIKCVALSNKLPPDLGFYSASYPEAKTRIAALQATTLRQINALVDFARKDSQEKLPVFQDREDLLDRYGSLWIDTLDSIFERVNSNFDALSGKDRTKLDASASAAAAATTKDVGQVGAIAKPQLKFADCVDNSEALFRPKISFKSNARKPLNLELISVPENMRYHLKSLGYDNVPMERYAHPYEFEISNLEYPPHLLTARPETLFLPLDQTPLTIVDTIDKLEALAIVLDAQQEFAIDLEHHDYRTFLGITCLMQISTRTEDFIVDVFAVWNNLNILNSSFTNPEIVKVMHGAKSDVDWLQRDFGIYIVGLFDTFHASVALQFPKKSLAYLIEHYVGLQLDKQYQLADWRIRPLPEALLRYAQEDTHYLLYIYDRMRNAVLDLKGPEMNQVLSRSQEVCLKTYDKPIYSTSAYRFTLSKFKEHAFTSKDVAVFKALHKWRDEIGRKEDESVNYVLPNNTLFRLAITAPTTLAELTRHFSPLPHTLRLYSKDILSLIAAALQEHENGSADEPELDKPIDHLTVLDRPPLAAHIHFDSDADLMAYDGQESSKLVAEAIAEPEALPVPIYERKIVPAKKMGTSVIFGDSFDAKQKSPFELNVEDSKVHFFLRTPKIAAIQLTAEEASEVEDPISVPQVPEEQIEATVLVAPTTMVPTEDASSEEVIVIGKLPKKRKDPSVQVSGTSETPAKKKKKRSSNTLLSRKAEITELSEASPIFDPYSTVVVDKKFTKPDVRTNVHMRSGSRQMSFKTNNKSK